MPWPSGRLAGAAPRGPDAGAGLAFRRLPPSARYLASPLSPAAQVSQTTPAPGPRQPPRCGIVPVLCGTPPHRPDPVRSATRPEPKVRPGQRPSCAPRVPPSAEGGTAPGDGRGPAGPMRQLRSSRSRRTRRAPAARGPHPGREPHLCRLACLERRVSWLSRWLLVSSGWRTRPVAAGRRRRREPAAIRSSAPVTSRTRRGCGAGRRCRCPGCPHHRDHRRSARTMITIITMRTTVPMPIYIDCSFSRGTRCR